MFKSIGFVISLIAIRLLLPTAFHAFESATVQFFGFTTEIFSHPPTAVMRDLGVSRDYADGQTGISSQTAGIGFVPHPAPMPDSYPMSQQEF